MADYTSYPATTKMPPLSFGTFTPDGAFTAVGAATAEVENPEWGVLYPPPRAF